MTPEAKAIERAMASLQEAYNVLNDLLPNDGKREQLKAKGEDYGSKRILKVVSDIFSINPLLKGRQKEVVLARHALRYLLRKHTMRSLESIGVLTGTHDHKSVLHSVRVAKDLIDSDPLYAALINKCEEVL